jgi:transcriptional regulator with XRE-family HTH domain
MQKSLHSADYKHFLEELRALRENLGVTQEQLADALGLHQTFVSKVERGVRRLDVVELRLWVRVLGVRLTDFAARLEERLGRHAAPKLGKSQTRKRS